MFRMKGLCKSEKGQSLVEFALILPVLLLLVFGIIEFGRALNTYLIISNASREGARYAVVGADNSEINSAILAKIPTLDPDNLSIDIDPGSKSERKHGAPVDIKVSYELNLITPIVGSLISDDNAIEIQSVTTMRME